MWVLNKFRIFGLFSLAFNHSLIFIFNSGNLILGENQTPVKSTEVLDSVRPLFYTV